MNKLLQIVAKIVPYIDKIVDLLQDILKLEKRMDKVEDRIDALGKSMAEFVQDHEEIEAKINAIDAHLVELERKINNPVQSMGGL